MTDIPKNTLTTNSENTMRNTTQNTIDNSDTLALAWIKSHEEGLTQSIPGESQTVIDEIDAVWAALDGLAEDDFPELAVFDESMNIQPASKPQQISTLQPNLKSRSISVLLRQPQYWGAIAAMLLIALLLPITYVGIPADYVVAKGQRDTVILSDGSRIELASNTRLSIREGWGQRAVTLEQGNAFFAVTANKDKPFVINAGKSTVTVLGTAFSVYRKQQHVEVVVESGKVNLLNISNNHRLPVDVDLIKNQKATIKKGETLEMLTNVNVDDAISWRRGFINFKQASLATIVERMNDFYDTPIYIRNNKRRQLVLSGVFKTDDLDSFLIGLKAIAEVSVERNPGGAIYLY
ncbi:hypothetical protein A9Q81_23275 [Gammaproteobacteria bacterium 42_54_T18]|nr:hypothetical protein A9Q81_23275 [Gammaproteobacteria bacterium 42_54_T18]